MASSKNKRRAIAGHKFIPDGMIGALDRRQIAGHYPIEMGAPSVFIVDGGAVVAETEPRTIGVVNNNVPETRTTVLQFQKG